MEFTFNASAIGAGGIIQRGDVTYVIPSLASVALAPTGGEGRSVVSNYVSEELSFSHAETRVYGRQHPKERVYTTWSYVYIRHLQVFDKLSIAEMRATVTSTRKFDDTEDQPFELEISYKGVSVGGRPLDLKVDEAVESVRRYDDLAGIVGGRHLPAGLVAARDRKGLAARFNAKSPDVLSERLKEKKAVQGSIIETVEGGIAKPSHNRIFIPGLGTVIFGELMLKPGRRRLNLLRIELGEAAGSTHFGGGGRPVMAMMTAESPRTGSMTLGSSEGNGTIVGP